MSLSQALADGAVMTKRNLLKIGRLPDLLVFSTVQPIMFVLLFAYIFGSAIQLPGMSYREFLLPGIFVQTVIFGATITGAGLADDIKKGIIERFRSLPISSSAVLIGRTTSDLLNNLLVVLIMAGTGPPRRLEDPLIVPRGPGRFRPAPRVCLRLLLGHGHRRTVGQERRSSPKRLVHRDLSSHVHRQHVCADGQFPGGSQGICQLESGVGADAGGARALRQHQPGFPGSGLVAPPERQARLS